jgi:DNA-binding transcriptional LysR family regulator
MDWDKLRVFYTVALCKSLTKAGESLNLSQSAVSRQISGLEERMNMPLFHRHARGLMLTEQGDMLFKTVAEMVTKLQATENALAEASTKPKGPFKLTAPAAFTTFWLTKQLKEFTDLYPEIDVTLVSEDRELDLTRREADVAIRVWPAKQPDLVQIPLMKLGNSLYASNDYLRTYGIPTMISDLAQHKLLGFDTSLSALPFAGVNWLYDLPEAKQLDLKPFFKANSLLALRTAVKQSMGIALLPDYLMHGARHISKVLPALQGPVTEAYYVYPVELKNSKRVNVFRSFLTQKLASAGF